MRSHRPVFTVRLYRPNIHTPTPSIGRDVGQIVQGATLLFLLYWIVVLVCA